MTYKNDIEVEFDHNGTRYAATADVVVTLRKADVGPIGYREHVMAYIPQDIEVNNLKVSDLDTIPDEIAEVARGAIEAQAAYRAEESFV